MFTFCVKAHCHHRPPMLYIAKTCGYYFPMSRFNNNSYRVHWVCTPTKQPCTGKLTAKELCNSRKKEPPPSRLKGKNTLGIKLLSRKKKRNMRRLISSAMQSSDENANQLSMKTLYNNRNSGSSTVLKHQNNIANACY